MESYRSEEEQVEALKRWWDENGRSTITAIIFALALAFGWQGWQQFREDKAAAASNTYQSMLQAFSQEEQAEGKKLAEDLKAEYPGTTYAEFAALHLARVAVEGGDMQAAETQLRWVVDNADRGSETSRVAQLRLARVVAESDPEQAMGIIEAADQGSFQAAFQVARGDILMQQQQLDAAREAYSSAMLLASRGGQQVNLALLQEKLQSLSPEAPQALSGAGDAAAAQPLETEITETLPAATVENQE